jgi:hypothetical protein
MNGEASLASKIIPVDLMTGTVSEAIPQDQLRYLAMSPDGRYLFTSCHYSPGRLDRYRIDGLKLALDEARPQIGTNPCGVYISADSKYVACPCGGGNSDSDGERHKGYSTYIFKIDNLKAPAVVLETGAYSGPIGFDVSSKRLYAQNMQTNLIAFSPDGRRERELDFGVRKESSYAFHVHPAGNHILVEICYPTAVQRSLVWLTLQ